MGRQRGAWRLPSGKARQRPSLERRLPDWEARLNALLAAERTRPHDYGRHDCILFCAAIVRAVTGKDLGRGHRGKYRTAAGAARYLRALGYDSPAALIDGLLPERPIGRARRGDLVMGSDGIPGGCIGDRGAFVGLAEARAGLVTAPRHTLIKAWSVG